MKRQGKGLMGLGTVVAALSLLLILPAAGSAGDNPVNDVVDNLKGTLNNVLGGGQGGATGQQGSGGGGQTSSRQASPAGGGYEPPLHGGNPHSQGTVATLDLGPESGRPLPGDPSGEGSGEDVVVGRARGERDGRDGAYRGTSRSWRCPATSCSGSTRRRARPPTARSTRSRTCSTRSAPAAATTSA